MNNNTNKPTRGFVLYESMFNSLCEILTAEELKTVLRIGFDYLKTEEQPDRLDGNIKFAWAFFRNDLQTSIDKHNARALAGSAGGTATQAKRSKTSKSSNATFAREHVANLANVANVANLPNTNTNPNSIPNTNPNPIPIPSLIYGIYRNVKLTASQYDQLLKEWGERALKYYVDKLSKYMHDKQKSYPNHYETLLEWKARDDLREEQKVMNENKAKNKALSEGSFFEDAIEQMLRSEEYKAKP